MLNALVNLMKGKHLAKKEGDEDLVEFLMEQIKQMSAALKATGNGNKSSSVSDSYLSYAQLLRTST